MTSSPKTCSSQGRAASSACALPTYFASSLADNFAGHVRGDDFRVHRTPGNSIHRCTILFGFFFMADPRYHVNHLIMIVFEQILDHFLVTFASERCNIQLGIHFIEHFFHGFGDSYDFLLPVPSGPLEMSVSFG